MFSLKFISASQEYTTFTRFVPLICAGALRLRSFPPPPP